ncbi:uncharacterized protein LOC124532964 isoform X1 [Vanessa cardui]|uniref:uncharacterized protein LOC124532964 isoform X1 n=1 Tax=Vanessa cardui TaxID=171605 RepID=UPI001F14798A|nr:uncharacterized protein LOC124532964 isoform X1 [Vanessa cardui]
MARWGDEKTLNFIHNYRNHECLWNVRSPYYKNKISREKAYQSLLESLNDNNLNLKSVKTKIKNLRSIYHTELKKVKYSKYLGSDGLFYKPSLSWFDEIHSFLRNTAECRETINNETVPQVSSDDNKCEQSIGEANEKLTEPLDPQSRLNDPKSTINDLDVSTQSTSKETLPRKVLPLRSTRKSSKHSPISTKESLCQKTERENDYISTTLQRLENISKGLNTTQQQLAQHTQDEFYFFALSVAAQLRILPLPIALETQSKIQNTLSAARLFLKPSPSSSNCNSPIYDQSANSLKTQDTGELVSFIKIEENALPLEQFEELM